MKDSLTSKVWFINKKDSQKQYTVKQKYDPPQDYSHPLSITLNIDYINQKLFGKF